MFPHFIASKNVNNQHVVLWQLGDYHYEIEHTAHAKPTVDLPNTPSEDAVKLFNETEVFA
jgi:hypothetical protein